MTLFQHILTVSVVLLLFSCKGDVASASSNNSENTSQTKGLPTVEVSKAQIRSFNDEQVITGNVKSDKAVYIHSMEQGVVHSMAVDIGDNIRKGQTLAILRNPMLNFDLKKAQSEVNQAISKLKSAEALHSMSQTDSKSRKGIYDRISSVYEKSKGLTTVVEFEDAKRQADMAKAQEGVAQSNVEQAKSALSTAQIMEEAIQERKAMLQIKAPFSGIISGRFADPGAMIQNALTDKNAKPLFSIESNNPVRLSLPIPESDISGIQKGDLVEIDFPSLPGKKINAKISRIAKSLDPASKTMEVQIDLDNKEGKIKAGMYAKARLKRSSSTEILSLPNAAIVIKRDAPFILIVEDGFVKEMQVKKGLSNKEFFEILNSEINQETQVITKGKSTVKAGQKVTALIK